MSMREYPLEDHGLVLSIGQLAVIASKVCEDWSREEWDQDQFSFIDEVAENVEIGLQIISDYSGYAIPIKEDGTEDYAAVISYDTDALYYIPTERNPQMFKAVYNDMGEIVSEFRELVGAYLPADFNYARQICHIIGSTFG